MKKISLYYILEDVFFKTTCLLIEKLYYANFKSVILTIDLESQELLNKLLWTYSKKKFIPHGSMLDPLPEQQPIYITHVLEYFNDPDILILINPLEIKNIFTKKDFFSRFKRLIIVINSFTSIDSTIHTIRSFFSEDLKISFYTQDLKGLWKESTY